MGVFDWMSLINDWNFWKISVDIVICLEFWKGEFLLMYLIQYIFKVEMDWLVLKLQISLVTEIVVKGTYLLQVDEIIAMETELNLIIVVQCFSHLTNMQ